MTVEFDDSRTHVRISLFYFILSQLVKTFLSKNFCVEDYLFTSLHSRTEGKGHILDMIQVYD